MDLELIILTISTGLVLGWMSTGGKKSQTIRLLDILLLGPLMIYVAITSYFQIAIHPLWIYTLLFFGATTISYNFKNYCLFL